MNNNEFDLILKALSRMDGKLDQNHKVQKGEGWICFTMPEHIKTKTGYKRDCISFAFDKEGKLDQITLSYEDFAMVETPHSGNVTNKVGVKNCPGG